MKITCVLTSGQVPDASQATGTVREQGHFYGGCLYPPEERCDVTDMEYIGGAVGKLGGLSGHEK